MPVNDVAQLTVVIQNAVTSDQFNNVLNFKFVDAAATLSGLASDFEANLLATWMGPSGNGFSCNLLRVRDVVPGTGAGVDHSVVPAIAGGAGTSEGLPFQNAAVITWRTALSGRAYRGRSFLCGMSEGHQTAGTLDSGEISLMQTIITNILARYGGSGASALYRFGVVSRTLNGVARPVPVWTQIEAGVARSLVKTQRRREIGVGS